MAPEANISLRIGLQQHFISSFDMPLLPKKVVVDHDAQRSVLYILPFSPASPARRHLYIYIYILCPLN